MPTVEGARVPLPKQGITIYARDWGGDGPPILLLHGLSSNSRIWDWTAPLLTDRFHVIALDQRGHGLADVPDDGYGFQETSGDVAEFIEQAGLDRPVVVGHSWGGSVAVDLAARYPDLVRGIVLVDGGFTSPSAHMTWEQAEKAMRPPDIPGIPVDAFMGGARNWPNIKDMWSNDLGEMILSNFEVRDAKVYRRLPIDKHMAIVRALFDQKPAEVMPQVRVPALLVPAIREPTNDYERTWSEWRNAGIEETQRLMPNAQLHAMNDSIHDVPVQRPRELAAVIGDFAGGLP